jgi:hypothetical protein
MLLSPRLSRLDSPPLGKIDGVARKLYLVMKRLKGSKKNKIAILDT